MTQATLFNYSILQEEDGGVLYKDLLMLGYVDSHKLQILRLLWDLKPHNSDEVVVQGGKQYNARILELRREGWNIVCERVSGGVGHYFTLLSRSRRFVK